MKEVAGQKDEWWKKRHMEGESKEGMKEERQCLCVSVCQCVSVLVCLSDFVCSLPNLPSLEALKSFLVTSDGTAPN